ncbi:response regulator [Candidatus Venteria ishoeyi]|uniref:Alkaline phosphatase synthesis transcriptional regulatory protein PhoP n=1 Tax=Candidatus Venteria ishoeyi TaxID=1899563 RepID=A0A1H6FB32_9GAMM|nr:response regulator [Candidatus Venteria ishoeyi]MDM8547194.1 response regulator [Candidatus Venteria ishoeyi]SEH06539.1 Alkaline phosphatase synthesis transcriptional regulatory protein PhoP [Candidatus Venteria ishoeyi]
MAISKIMVVDDSTVDLLNLKNIVSDAGYQVITASSGQEAIDKSATEMPDLIFMDVVMQQMDGYQACREISHEPKTKHIPIIFVTSKGQKADRMWAEMQGGKSLVQKPYTPAQIIEQINAFQ